MSDDLIRIVSIQSVGERTFRLPRRMYEAATMGLYNLDKPGASPAWPYLRGPLIVAMLWADEARPLPVALPAVDAPVKEWEAAGRSVVDFLVDEDAWPELAIGKVGMALLQEANARFGLVAAEDGVPGLLDFGVRRQGSTTSSG